MKKINDMRDYIEELKKADEITIISEEVDWDLEMGAIIRWINDNKAPAALFTNIKNSKYNFRVIGSPVGVSKNSEKYLARYAISCGLDPHTKGSDIVKELVKAYDRPKVKANVISTENAPVQENIISGDQINLFDLPVPIAHNGDGGRYINTWGVIMIATPDGKWTNWSIARIMINDEKTMVGIVADDQHIGLVKHEWSKVGKEAPYALVFGGNPFIPIVGGSSFVDKDVNEADFISSYLQDSMEMVKCVTNDIFVPANAELVIEGRLSSNKLAPEGPMGEYLGYIFEDSFSLKPVYQVDAITFRNNPIYPVVVAGAPVDDDHPVMGIGASTEILHQLKIDNISVREVWVNLESACTWLIITMKKNWYEEMACTEKELMDKLISSLNKVKGPFFSPKILIMDEDIDPTNLEEIVWAFGTRYHPINDNVYRKNSRVLPLISYLTKAEAKTGTSTSVLYNCLWPIGKSVVNSRFSEAYPEEVKEKALIKLKNAGFL